MLTIRSLDHKLLSYNACFWHVILGPDSMLVALTYCEKPIANNDAKCVDNAFQRVQIFLQ